MSVRRDHSSASPLEPESAALDWVVRNGSADEVFAQVAARGKRRRQRRAFASGVVAAFALGWAAWWGVPYVRDTDAMTTVAAQRQQVALADGSQLVLNARTQLRTDFRGERRTVTLKHGEAFFSVARDSARPFLVQTPVGVVRVTGTQFNVRMSRDSQLAVTLVEGSVEIQLPAKISGTRADAMPGELVCLQPGQQLQLTEVGHVVGDLTETELDAAVAWREGKLLFADVALSDAVAAVADYHEKRIEVSPAVAGLRLGGSYSLDNLESFLGAVETALPVRVTTGSDGVLRIVAR